MNNKPPIYAPLHTQKDYLVNVVLQNPHVNKILERTSTLFPEGTVWYLGAGGINQTVWNYISNKPLTSNIADYDLIYWDSEDITYEGEDKYIQKAKELFKDIPVPVDLKNQARVHLWYEKHFGKKIDQYESCEHAIATWPTTATAVGVTRVGDTYSVCAPYGLTDLFNMVIRQTHKDVIKGVYLEKTKRWKKHWPLLTVLPYIDTWE